jgi:hypothetical protein
MSDQEKSQKSQKDPNEAQDNETSTLKTGVSPAILI